MSPHQVFQVVDFHPLRFLVFKFLGVAETDKRFVQFRNMSAKKFHLTCDIDFLLVEVLAVSAEGALKGDFEPISNQIVVLLPTAQLT